jgi:hypothetical protein
MPRVVPTLEGPEFPKLKKIYENLARVVNGNVELGNTVDGAINVQGKWVTVTFAAPNTDQTITHNLGRLPAGYIPMQKTAACDVYTGTVPATDSQITLKGTVATTVVLFIC